MFLLDILPVMMRRPLWLSLSIFTVCSIGVWFLKKTFFNWLEVLSKKTATQFDDNLVIHFKNNMLPVLYGLPFYVAFKVVTDHPRAEKFLDTLGALFLVFFGVRFLVSIVSYSIEYYLLITKGDTNRVQNFKAFATVIKIMLWITASLLVLDNLGFKVTSVIAGLGIGGVAIALAAQATLGDFFSYLIIIFDRPFDVGHSIRNADVSGTVENIGIKTTKVRNLEGELVVMPNSGLTGKTLFNLSAMEQKRSLSRVAVSYLTEVEKLQKIPSLLQAAVESQKGTLFDRAHLVELGDGSINFELVYFVVGSDYKNFLLTQQNVFLQIMQNLNLEEIKWAFPKTQLLLTPPQTT